MPNHDPFRIANAHLDLWNNRNFTPVRDLLAPNATIRYLWENNDRPADQSLDHFDNMWHNAFPDIRWNIDNIIWTDNRVTLEWNAQGTNTGRFMDNNASGRHINWRGANVIDLDSNGHISRENVYTDMLNILWQMGVTNNNDANQLTEMANNWINACNRRDLDWLDSNRANDFVYNSPNGNICNWDNLRDTLLMNWADSPDLTFTVNQVDVHNNQVMMTVNMNGTIQNSTRHTPTNNQKMNVDSCWILTFDNNKVCRLNQYQDNWSWQVNAGVNPNLIHRMNRN